MTSNPKRISPHIPTHSWYYKYYTRNSQRGKEQNGNQRRMDKTWLRPQSYDSNDRKCKEAHPLSENSQVVAKDEGMGEK